MVVEFLINHKKETKIYVTIKRTAFYRGQPMK